MTDSEKVFSKHDVNKDGKMSSKELEAALKELGVPASSTLIQGILAQYDKPPHDGFISLTEFQNLATDMEAITKTGLEETLKHFTETYDKDGSGFITRDELKAGMVTLGMGSDDATVNAIIQMSDVNNDGKISVQEFAAVIGHGK
ncbi:calcium-dependent protein kinase 19-like [Branchiostoma floridae]|uniref:Calcium-dependent protein kinase 19-like n=1 Tax=Branchiostoma floridae TaxID=7739 RepID=A0A9J7M3K5_BRAFL|nr:calcium-dependent protein kinase 19-like [Branchiostoma floridae]